MALIRGGLSYGAVLPFLPILSRDESAVSWSHGINPPPSRVSISKIFPSIADDDYQLSGGPSSFIGFAFFLSRGRGDMARKTRGSYSIGRKRSLM